MNIHKLLLLAILPTALAVAGCGSAGICGQSIDKDGTEYIQNGEFLDGLTAWQKVDLSSQHSGQGHEVLGIKRIDVENNDCGNVVTLHREGSSNTSALFGVEQSVSVEKGGISELKLQMLVKIDNQQLTSDGFIGGETPVFITLDYETTAGESKSWAQGFLDKNSRVNYPERDQIITPSYWFKYSIDNVFEKLPDAARITKVTIGGSGEDFHSGVRLVSLLGK